MRKIFITGLLVLLLTKCTKNHSFETKMGIHIRHIKAIEVVFEYKKSLIYDRNVDKDLLKFESVETYKMMPVPSYSVAINTDMGVRLSCLGNGSLLICTKNDKEYAFKLPESIYVKVKSNTMKDKNSEY